MDINIKRQTSIKVITALFFSVGPTAALLVFGLSRTGCFVNLNNDAVLYLSIADNFLSTGHFIQYTREYANFVVPSGVPFILTVFRALGLSIEAIICIQIGIVALSNYLLYSTEKRICGHGGIAPVLFTLALMKNAVFFENVWIEYYFMLMLISCIYIIFKPMKESRKLILLNIFGFAAVMMRPVVAVVYAFILGYTIWRSIASGKLVAVIPALLLPAIVLSLNCYVNYRETGEVILLENYSGWDMYCFTNTYWDPDETEHIKLMEEISYPGANQSERNQILKTIYKERVLADPAAYFEKAAENFYLFFIYRYYGAGILAFIGGILMVFKSRDKERIIRTLSFAASFILCTVTSFGVLIWRYSNVMWILGSIHIAFLSWYIFEAIPEKYLPKFLKNIKAII